MNQICTNKKQSSRLLEAGVRPGTADMSYHFTRSRVPTLEWELQTKPPTLRGKLWTPQRIAKLAIPFDKHPDGTHMTGEEVFDNLFGKDVPAWSLSKLIDMMPPAIDGLGTLYLCAGLNTKKYNADNKVKDHLYSIEYGVNYTSHRYDDPIEALIETIEWLIKEGHLDKKFLSVKCGDCKLIEDEDTNGEAWCAFHQKPVRCDGEACSNLLGKGGSNA